MGRLVDRFLGGAGLPGSPGSSDELEARLATLIADARAIWPGISIDDEAFAAFLGERVPAEPAPAGALDELPVGDLWLACACAAGDDRAIAAFEDRYLRGTALGVAQGLGAKELTDELQQVLRRLLFVSRPGGCPAIADFHGQGNLGGWLRVVAVRELRRLQRKANREVLVDDDRLLDVLSPRTDPELEQLKQAAHDAFAEVFRDAVAALTPRERLVLRYQTVDGLSIDDIAAIHRVHRATAARWLVRARDRLVTELRARLMRRLKLSRSEERSLLALIRSRLDLSLERVLADDRGSSERGP